jgi:hypothetical protein
MPMFGLQPAGLGFESLPIRTFCYSPVAYAVSNDATQKNVNSLTDEGYNREQSPEFCSIARKNR